MSSSNGATVLVVEDDPDDARFVERLLADSRSVRRGGEPLIEIGAVEHAGDLAAGLDRVDPASTDAVLLDLGLPDSSGLETVDAMVERAPTVPIVVLTGRTDAGVDAIRRGAQDYLVKGRITADLLRRSVRYAIERARVARDLHDRNHRLALVHDVLGTDLRNDVSVIVGLGDQLRERVGPDDRALVESLLDASRHVLDLTDTAAELVNVLSGDPNTVREPVDLRTLLDAELERFRADADVDLAVDWHVPASESLTVAGTPMLGSMFEHLLSNAALRADREAVQIAVTVTATDDGVSVSIADDGARIPDARKDAIVGSDPGEDSWAGVGAGYYFVTTVLESIDGDLEIEDNHPAGTVVTVTLDRIGVP